MWLPRSHTAVIARPHPLRGGVLDAFERLRAEPIPWLLDSALPSERLGRFSFAGADPYLVMRARGRRIELECRRAVRPGLEVGRRVVEADPLQMLRSLLPAAPSGPGPGVPFAAGAVGYLGYELAERIEPLGLGGLDDLGLPDLVLLFVDRVLALDARGGDAMLLGLGFGSDAAQARAAAERSAEGLARSLAAPAGGPRCGPRRARRGEFSFFDESTYAKAVAAVLDEIGAGNVYQACLTQRVERDFSGDPWQLYRRLRALNPAPFAAYLELPELSVASSSPERFLKLDPDGWVESRPIKGTRTRGRDGAEDAAQRSCLAGSEKDRAENLMIVDLVRNDLGRVCETGSVCVPELMAIEAYASLFQMVSTVRGRLRRGCDAVDLVRACFPPGSMTGAPKIAAMRLLDRLEPVRRGPYSGAIGYFDVRGGADLAVVIRTVLVREGRAYLHSGGGVVADSDPVAEHREALDKLRLPLAALEASGAD